MPRGQHFKDRTHCPEGHPYDEENTRWVAGRRHCIKCGRASSRAYYAKHKERLNKERKLLLYGLTVKQFDAMFRKQRGRCAICRKIPKGKGIAGVLHIDHSERTCKVRGLLCTKCNRGIGLLCESPEIMRRAAEYIEVSIDR